jgi:hypothetical protein
VDIKSGYVQRHSDLLRGASTASNLIDAMSHEAVILTQQDASGLLDRPDSDHSQCLVRVLACSNPCHSAHFAPHI